MFVWEFAFCLFTSNAYKCTWIGRHLKETVLWSKAEYKRTQHCWILHVASVCTPSCMLFSLSSSSSSGSGSGSGSGNGSGNGSGCGSIGSGSGSDSGNGSGSGSASASGKRSSSINGASWVRKNIRSEKIW